MSKRVILKGDMSAGSDGYVPTPAIEGDSHFTVNGIPVVTVGCRYQDHKEVHGDNIHTNRIQSGASSNIFINGKEVAISGDPISCGDTAGEGSGFNVDV